MIPEKIAIRLINSTDITAEKFFNAVLKRYRDEQRRLREARRMQGKNIPTKANVLVLPTEAIAPTINNAAKRRDSGNSATKQHSNGNDGRNADAIVSTITSTATTDAYQQNALAYMDDEDMVNDYDNSEGSAARPLWNDTAAAFAILNENDTNRNDLDDDDTD